MTIHNHPEALTQLRADHVEVEYSPLEKIAIELFGVKVNPFKTHMQSRGHTHPKAETRSQRGWARTNALSYVTKKRSSAIAGKVSGLSGRSM